MIRRAVLALFAAASLFAAGSCSSAPPFQYYMLTTAAPSSPPLLTPQQSAANQVGLGPVSVPSYLDRSNIVRRDGVTSVELSATDRWAEPLQDMLPRVLADNLASRLGVDRVVVLPTLRSQPLSFQVEVNFIRFDTDATGEAVLAAEWDLFSGTAAEPVQSGVTRARRAAAGDDRSAQVIALSATLGNLADEIARVVATRIDTAPVGLNR